MHLPLSSQTTSLNAHHSAIAAALIWGLSPLYFKTLDAVSEGEVLAQRIVWALLLLLTLLVARRGSLRPLLAQPRNLMWLALSALLLGGNWLTFIWGVSSGRVLEVSLGYFIYPLLASLLGMLFLGERPRRIEQVAMMLALVGVLIFALQLDGPPWVALTLAFSFSLYSLIRKRVDASPLQALTLELILLAPAAIGWLIWLYLNQRLSFGSGQSAPDLLIMLLGVVTVLPLVLYTHSMRGLSLTLTGMVSYLAPVLNLLLAVWLFGEPFAEMDQISFAFIITALAVLGLGGLRTRQRQATASAV